MNISVSGYESGTGLYIISVTEGSSIVDHLFSVSGGCHGGLKFSALVYKFRSKQQSQLTKLLEARSNHCSQQANISREGKTSRISHSKSEMASLYLRHS